MFNNEKIEIDVKSGSRFINIKDIICFEAFGDGTYIYTVSDVLESAKPLKYWANKMDADYFYQVHRAFVVAFRYVDGIGTEKVQMCHMKMSVPVSRRNRKEFREKFLNYIKRK